MADDSTAVVDDFKDAPAATAESAPDLGDAGKQALDRMKAERNEANKALKTLQRELEQVRKASMSEAEKAVAEAEQRGRSSALTEYGKRLARSEFNAAAARRNPAFDTAALDYLDLSRFVGDDGEPDSKAISEAIERLVPTSDGRPRGDVDQGVRPNQAPAGMNDLIRRAARR